MSGHALLSPQAVLHVPTDVAVCPYCGAALRVTFGYWQQQEDGSWTARDVQAECAAQPTTDGEKWRDWAERHSCLPYIHQVPVDTAVERWVNTYYRFVLEEQGEP